MLSAQAARWPGQTATAAGALDQPIDRYVKPGLDAPRSAGGDEIVRSALGDYSLQDCPRWSLFQLRPRLARGQNPAGSSLKTCAGWRASATVWHRSPVRSTDIAIQPALPTPLPSRVSPPIVEDVLWPVVSFFSNLGLAIAQAFLRRFSPYQNYMSALGPCCHRLRLRAGPQRPLQQCAEFPQESGLVNHRLRSASGTGRAKPGASVHGHQDDLSPRGHL